MTTNELEGRALHEAAARAMGWTPFDVQHMEHGMPSTEKLLAWLHERGEVEAYSNAKGAFAALWLPNVADNDGGCKVGGTSPAFRGRDLREALARLVVAVAAREAKQA